MASNKGRSRGRRGGGKSNRGKGRRGGRGRSRIRWKEIVDDPIADLRGRLVELRRDFHRYPELAFEEKRTAKNIAETLEDLGLEVRTGIAKTGVVGILEGGRPGPTVMWRADMDGLPVQESKKGDYTSRNEGVSHVCGHDGHMAIALGMANILSERADDLPGTVKFVFQPGEEGGAGAQKMIQEGVLDDPDVDAVFGLHLSSELPTGIVAVADGAVMAASDDFTIRLSGGGGHAAAPHRTSDPIVAAAHLITALQSLVSRQVDPTEEVVLSIGTIQGGTAANVVPKEVSLTGTLRAFDKNLQKEIHKKVQQLSRSIAEGFGLKAHIDKERGYPTTSNDPKLAARVREVLKDSLGDDSLQPMKILGSEDMAYFLKKVPGCYFLVGSGNERKGCTEPHHSPDFDLDEDSLPLGVHLGAQVLEDYLEEHAEQTGSRRRRSSRSKGRRTDDDGDRDGRRDRRKDREDEREDEEVAAEADVEEEEVEEEQEYTPEAFDEEFDFARTRRRRRRVGSREKREALLPEHLGPRAKDAEKAVWKERVKDADDEDEDGDSESEPSGRSSRGRDRGGDRDRGRDRKDSRSRGDRKDKDRSSGQQKEDRGRSGSSRRRDEDRKESDREEEKKSPEPAQHMVVGGDDDGVSAMEAKLRQARTAGSLQDEDLTPLHKKQAEAQGREVDEEDSEEEGKKKRGGAPWLWKGRKSRR